MDILIAIAGLVIVALIARLVIIRAGTSPHRRKTTAPPQIKDRPEATPSSPSPTTAAIGKDTEAPRPTTRIEDAIPSIAPEDPHPETAPPPTMTVGAPAGIEPPAGPKNDVERVFFGTDREIEAQSDTHVEFNAERADKLTLGYADISVPELHKLGRVERPKHYSILGRTIYRQRERAEKHFIITKSETTSVLNFSFLAADEVKKAERFPGTAFIFLHGFNVTFEAALYRTAQLSYDLGFDGATFLYSWPAQGKTLSYATDMDSAMHAAPHLDQFIDVVLNVPGIDRVHLVAHSMGNFALAELVRRVGLRVQEHGDKFLDQLVLAAPDIDVDLFKDVAEHFVKHARHVTLYACASDKALLAARAIRDHKRRAGDVPDDGPVVVEGIDSIDISAVGSDILFAMDHSIYAEDRGLLNDLGLLMLNGLHPPEVRMPTLRVVDGIGGRYWVMPV